MFSFYSTLYFTLLHHIYCGEKGAQIIYVIISK